MKNIVEDTPVLLLHVFIYSCFCYISICLGLLCTLPGHSLMGVLGRLVSLF